MSGRQRRDGFTLIEVMVALAILGTALYVLMETHYRALRMFDDTQTEVEQVNLMQQAVARAEMEVLAGNESGKGEFNKRYEGFAYSFQAQLVADERIPLFEVTVTLTAPTRETQTLLTYVYNLRGSDLAPR